MEHYRNSVKRLSDRVEQLEADKERLEGENRNLKEEIAALRAQATKLRSMLFKANASPPPTPKEGTDGHRRQRGGQLGHAGHGRKRPQEVDAEAEVFLTRCPTCTTPLARSPQTYTRIVEDIPASRAVTTRYTIERQWCGTCRKEVHGIPKNTVPRLRVGIRTLTLILFLRYRLRTPLEKVSEILRSHHGLRLSPGGIQEILRTIATRWTPAYERMLADIRAAPVTHADETSWRIAGQNGWCWLFATPNAALYTIEETRGKGVPQRIFGPHPEGVLVRDDYGGYHCLRTMAHQSCWAHLLRVSHEAVALPSASSEMQQLHGELRTLFTELRAIVAQPFQRRARTQLHARYAERIRAIGARAYAAPDARKVQGRIRNQGSNLITALLHANVPLTNNHAERQIRPMAVMRKISGGSRSPAGAAIHSVNMSILQTIALCGKDYLTEITRLLTGETVEVAGGR
jgi:transposase